MLKNRDLLNTSNRKQENINYEEVIVRGNTGDIIYNVKNKVYSPVDKIENNIENYDDASKYLQRAVNVILYNNNNGAISFKGAKFTASGSKFIGIQQDNFSIKLNNINYALLANALSRGYRYVKVTIEQEGLADNVVFVGEIRMVNTGKSSAVEREVELVCLTRASDVLANLVVPFTKNSSINAWSVWEAFEELQNTVYSHHGVNIAIESELKSTLEGIKIRDTSYSAQKAPIDIIEDLIGLANKHLDPLSAVNWFDYKLTSVDAFGASGVISIFSQLQSSLEIIEISPETGLLDAPSISDLEISFNHIYHAALVPGRVVKLNNRWVSTMGAESAFIWAWDPQHLYVLTEIRYSFGTYPNSFTVSAKARSFNKYRNFTSTNEIYKGD